jgi:hypothetical protein
MLPAGMLHKQSITGESQHRNGNSRSLLRVEFYERTTLLWLMQDLTREQTVRHRTIASEPHLMCKCRCRSPSLPPVQALALPGTDAWPRWEQGPYVPHVIMCSLRTRLLCRTSVGNILRPSPLPKVAGYADKCALLLSSSWFVHSGSPAAVELWRVSISCGRCSVALLQGQVSDYCQPSHL